MKKKTLLDPQLPSHLEPTFLDFEEEAFFEGAYFQDQDVSYCSGSNIIIRESQLEHVIMQKGRFERFECANVVFEKCDLSNVEWLAASFHQVAFHQCKLIGTNFAESYLRDCRFVDCIANFASFSNTNQKAVTFQNCHLKDSEFYDVTWKQLTLESCDLTGSNWFHTNLNGLDFRHNQFEKIALSLENARGLKVNQEQAITIAASLGLVIED